MILDEKTRFQIVALGLGIAAVLGYGIFRALDKPQPVVPAPVATPAAPQQVTVSSNEPGKPNVSIRGENSVIAGTKGHETAATGDPELAFEWTIQGGTIEGDEKGATVIWTAGDGPNVIITCKAVNQTGQEATVSIPVNVLQPPAITRFEVVPDLVTEGSSIKLAWTATNTTKLVLDPGAIDVTQPSEPFQEFTPTETTTYTLKATNSTGVVATREVTVKVVSKPEITSLKANPVPGNLEAFEVVGVFKGGKAELKNGGTVIASGEASPLTTRIDGMKAGGSLTFTVTNETGLYATTSLTFSTRRK